MMLYTHFNFHSKLTYRTSDDVKKYNLYATVETAQLLKFRIHEHVIMLWIEFTEEMTIHHSLKCHYQAKS